MAAVEETANIEEIKETRDDLERLLREVLNVVESQPLAARDCPTLRSLNDQIGALLFLQRIDGNLTKRDRDAH